jgi:hypothetical protein
MLALGETPVLCTHWSVVRQDGSHEGSSRREHAPIPLEDESILPFTLRGRHESIVRIEEGTVDVLVEKAPEIDDPGSARERLR